MSTNTDDIPKTRAEAKRLGYSKYFTGRPCKNGHIDVRHTSNLSCASCLRAWRENNKEKMQECRKRWREENRDWRLKYNRKWDLENPGRTTERNKKWRENNPERAREIDAARHAAQLQRTPKWIDRERISLVYAEAKRLSEETGEDYEVDHVYPLQGDTVSGLHVAENLKAIPCGENRRKGKMHPDDYAKRVEE